MLKEVKIRNAKPQEKPYRLPDGGWLYLEIRPNRKRGQAGRKVWLLKYRQPDTRKERVVGQTCIRSVY